MSTQQAAAFLVLQNLAQASAAAPSLPAPGCEIGPGEHVFLTPPAGMPDPQELRVAVRALAAAAPPNVAPVTFRPVREADPRLGPAILHCRRNKAVIYCRQDDMTTQGAEVMATLTGQLGADLARRPADRVRVTASIHAIGHAELRDLDPAACLYHWPHITVCVCEEMLTAVLAASLSRVITAQLRCLPLPPGLQRRLTPPPRQEASPARVDQRFYWTKR